MPNPDFTFSSARSSLLSTEGLRDQLAQTLKQAKSKILVLSAFLTEEAMVWFADHVNPSLSECTIVARWTCKDLISGSSDLSAYEIARSRNWKFAMHEILHAKLFLIDDSVLLVGSSNLTASGMELFQRGNVELGLCVRAINDDVTRAWGLVDDAVVVTPDLYEKMRTWIDIQKASSTGSKDIGWPPDILSSLTKVPSHLWTADLPWLNAEDLSAVIKSNQKTKVSDRYAAHDLDLLGINLLKGDTFSEEQLRKSFRASPGWQWLTNVLSTKTDRQERFGGLSSQLHSALLDDPKQYRRDVKTLLSNLFSYIGYLNLNEVELDSSSHSQRVRLV